MISDDEDLISASDLARKHGVLLLKVQANTADFKLLALMKLEFLGTQEARGRYVNQHHALRRNDVHALVVAERAEELPRLDNGAGNSNFRRRVGSRRSFPRARSSGAENDDQEDSDRSDG